MNKKIIVLISFFAGNAYFGSIYSDDSMDTMMPPAPEACYSIKGAPLSFQKSKKHKALKPFYYPMPEVNSVEAIEPEPMNMSEQSDDAVVQENSETSGDMIEETQAPVAIADMPTVSLNNFSNKFLDECPHYISQVTWVNNLLLPLQMLTDVALSGISANTADKENIIITLTENCMSQGMLFLAESSALDADTARELKEKVDAVCLSYIKRVTDEVVTVDVNNGNAEEVLEMIQDIENATPAQDDVSSDEMNS